MREAKCAQRKVDKRWNRENRKFIAKQVNRCRLSATRNFIHWTRENIFILPDCIRTQQICANGSHLRVFVFVRLYTNFQPQISTNDFEIISARLIVQCGEKCAASKWKRAKKRNETEILSVKMCLSCLPCRTYRRIRNASIDYQHATIFYMPQTLHSERSHRKWWTKVNFICRFSFRSYL